MVIEHYTAGPGPVYERAASRGRMLPDGLHYVDSWIVDDGNLDRCFQLMETDDPLAVRRVARQLARPRRVRDPPGDRLGRGRPPGRRDLAGDALSTFDTPWPTSRSCRTSGSSRAAPEETILGAALREGIPFAHVCGGRALCSTCRVLVVDGRSACTPRTAKERAIADRLGFSDEFRLACQTSVTAEVTVRRLVLDNEDIELADLRRRTGRAGGPRRRRTPIASTPTRAQGTARSATSCRSRCCSPTSAASRPSRRRCCRTT